MNSSLCRQSLLDFAQAHSCSWSFEPDEPGQEWGIHQLDDPPHNRLLGPVFARGGPCGLVLKEGRELAQWGDIHRADMTFSVTKTYLALTAGVAYDQGILPDLDDPVCRRLPGLGFDDEHNRRVTWRHLMHFTSEWHGSCFGVPDQIDRYRTLSHQPVKVNGRKGDARPLQIPGSFWEYNDVRINQFSCALMHLFERPLPDVFAEHFMQPLGASETWRWHGYNNSWVELGSSRIQSVPGGGHWGGGMVISAHDQALVARLLIEQGSHNGVQLVSPDWISQMLTPCPIAPYYGFYTWLNTDHAISQSASEHSYFAIGVGGQLVWHDPSEQLVAIFRWADSEQIECHIQLVKELIQAR